MSAQRTCPCKDAITRVGPGGRYECEASAPPSAALRRRGCVPSVANVVFSGVPFRCGSTTRLRQASSLSCLPLLSCSLSPTSSLPLCFSPSSLGRGLGGHGSPGSGRRRRSASAREAWAFQFPSSQRTGRCLLDQWKLLDVPGAIVSFPSVLGALYRMFFTMAFNGTILQGWELYIVSNLHPEL